MTVSSQLSVSQLSELQASATKPIMVLKLRAVILALEGWIARDIAAALGKGVRTVQQWVINFNQRGIDGLADQRGGNHFHLTEEQEQQLMDFLDAKANDPNDGVRHAEELIPWIEQMFGKTYSLSGLYDLLHRLNFSWLMPRPRHEKNDPAVVEAFKKTRRRSWKQSPENIPARRSRSGSRTKRDLAKRGR